MTRRECSAEHTPMEGKVLDEKRFPRVRLVTRTKHTLKIRKFGGEFEGSTRENDLVLLTS